MNAKSLRHIESTQAGISNTEIRDGLLIRGLVRPYGFLLISFVLFCLAVLPSCAHKNEVDFTLFLGPPLGETILLEGIDGGVTRRTCISISDEGTYSIEERTRVPGGQVTQEDIIKNKIPESVVRIMEGEDDLVNNYTLQAKDGKIILHSITFDETGIMVDLESRKWVQYSSSTVGKIEMECRIVGEKDELVHGENRKVIYIEGEGKVDGRLITMSYRIASGLGIIHMEQDENVLYTLKNN